MIARILLGLAPAVLLWLSVPASAQESLQTYKSLTPALALELAQATLADCQKRGFQAAVAVVDRFGVVQVILRDRYAGPAAFWVGLAQRSAPRKAAADSVRYAQSVRRPGAPRQPHGSLPAAPKGREELSRL